MLRCCSPSSTTTAGTGSQPLGYKAINTTNGGADYAYAGGMIEGDSATYGRADSGIAADIFSPLAPPSTDMLQVTRIRWTHP